MGGPKRAEMLERAPGVSTVPQIFINGTHVGGSDDLAALEAAGQARSALGRMSANSVKVALLQMTSGIDPASQCRRDGRGCCQSCGLRARRCCSPRNVRSAGPGPCARQPPCAA